MLILPVLDYWPMPGRLGDRWAYGEALVCCEERLWEFRGGSHTPEAPLVSYSLVLHRRLLSRSTLHYISIRTLTLRATDSETDK